MNKISICTIVSLNYFANALTLFDSVKKFHNDIDCNLLIVDKDINLKELKNTYKIYTLKDIKINKVEDLAFKYNVTEFNTAVKPFFMEYLYKNNNYESVIYLDPDMMLFNKMDLLLNLLDRYSMVLTPHICEDRYKEGTLDEKSFLQTGVFNLGFIATKNDENTLNMLKWWKNRLYNECYLDGASGLAWDQKWMNFLPALFEGVYVLRNFGYNMAHWNMHERHLSKVNNEYIINNKYKLVIYHFSQYKISNPEFIMMEPNYIVNNPKDVKLSERPDLNEIYKYYYEMIIKNDYEKYSKIKYGFNTFNNGVEILKVHRRLYGGFIGKVNFYKDPFSTEESNCFYKWLLKEGYIYRGKKEKNKKNARKNGLKTSFKEINMLLNGFKLLRKLVGVKKYESLLRKIQWASDTSVHGSLYLISKSKEKK